MGRLLWLMLVVWLAVYVWSFRVMITTDPSGDGFTHGINRLVGFMTWQIVAAGIAVAIWVMGRSLTARSPGRWISRGPGALALLPVLAIILLIAYAQISRPNAAAPQTPAAMPVTAPID